MTIKDYTPKTKKKEVGFRLYGHTFMCHPIVRSGAVLAFIDLMETTPEDGADPNQLKSMMVAIDQLFEAAIADPEDFARWQEMRDSNTEIIDLSTLVEIGTDLARAYSEGAVGSRPTGESSADGSSKKSPGKGSTAGVPSKALTYSRPDPTSLSA